ncbi:serine hydrolase domain-containing protein [Jiulongibacter sp. NS-SX5]|uniref:serine hydrolase domain-containing protein n=1 Tax=Jiulongibacter sp. NS-SX5 TaxID=3463854 RepID=UPI00405825A6
MKLPFLTLGLCLSLFASAQTPSLKKTPPISPAKAETAGISSVRLERVSGMIEKAISDNVIPGAAAIIVRNGKIVYHQAFGYSDVVNKKEFQKDAIFRIASQTKAIATTAAMMLWEEGKFQLDDPVSKYIPEFKNPQVLDRFRMADSSYTTKPAGKEITIRHLITHSSGIGYGVIDGDERFKAIYKKAGITDLFTTEPVTIEESVKRLAKLPLHHVPGERFTYSEGLDVLGYLIEIWSGEPFDQYLRKHIFEPLQMTDTWFYLPADKTSRLVEVQTKDETGNWVHFTDTFYDVNYPKTGAKTFFGGGAGLSSTLKDYATFLQMYLNKGEYNGVRLLSRTTVDFMLQDQLGDIYVDHSGFGLGFEILNEYGASRGGKGSQGTFRWGGYFNTQYFADPKENVIGIIMKQTQRVGGDYTGDLFRQMVFQTIDD